MPLYFSPAPERGSTSEAEDRTDYYTHEVISGQIELICCFSDASVYLLFKKS